jgi:hypothetical protein
MESTLKIVTQRIFNTNHYKQTYCTMELEAACEHHGLDASGTHQKLAERLADYQIKSKITMAGQICANASDAPLEKSAAEIWERGKNDVSEEDTATENVDDKATVTASFDKTSMTATCEQDIPSPTEYDHPWVTMFSWPFAIGGRRSESGPSRPTVPRMSEMKASYAVAMETYAMPHPIPVAHANSGRRRLNTKDDDAVHHDRPENELRQSRRSGMRREEVERARKRCA